MEEWNLWQGKKGRNPEKNLPKLNFAHYETHMEERDANSGPQMCEANV